MTRPSVSHVARTLISVAAAVAVATAVLLVGWRLDVLGARSASPVASVATAFDPPPGSPGYQWQRSGQRVKPGELGTFAGPDHCGWQSATVLLIGWPVGTASATAADARQYIRDPHGAIQGASFQERLQLSATLPTDAKQTGYRYGAIEIYLSPSDQDQAIYLVSPSGAERWPRSDPMTFCV